MNKIKSIIREEIGRFIINENINNLSRYANTINGYLNQMANIDSLQPQVKQVTMNFMKYCIQIIHAINRCVQANSLNEGLRISFNTASEVCSGATFNRPLTCLQISSRVY